ncbi:hypothetical protein HHK36_031955 [Tetracentron sinense]|uniref:Protein kinase domain-containing protein n=1 Tax=Tetracentron sinense TaxID=13715 RepID=A0A835CXL3_TETSI|nr:hypothetical protein HHK36_031955 [Tetracentron sinense]
MPQLIASGRIIHPGQCRRPSSGGNCDHPWCGTPILVTSPVGESVADMVRDRRFGLDDALKCCHDCLSVLSTAASVGIRHGDIRPENVICVSSGVRHPYYVLIGWGHAILEERDRPAMNLHFSSTHALQEGKLCSASDAESLVYLLYFSSGGISPDLDSVEGALQWREASWSRRLIQQKLGDISAVLKAFADYVDSLCGTPYPMDYEVHGPVGESTASRLLSILVSVYGLAFVFQVLIEPVLSRFRVKNYIKVRGGKLPSRLLVSPVFCSSTAWDQPARMMVDLYE